MLLAILYMKSIHKSKLMSKYFVLNHTKLLLHKLKNDNGAKRKNERVYTKRNKMSRLNIFNNNNMKRKLLRRNVPFKNQVEPSPTAIANDAIKRKLFEKKSKRGTTYRVCNVKLHKPLLKLVKLLFNLKFNKSKLIMDFLCTKSNMRTIILNVKGVIITIANNTMKSSAMASSSSQCPSSKEAMIRKSTSHGH